MNRQLQTGSTVFGLIVLGLGVLFLLDTTGVADNLFFDWWPVVLIVWGLSVTVRERFRGFFGPILVLLGLGFLLRNLDVLEKGWFGRWWPLAIIVVGLVILFGARRGHPGNPSHEGVTTRAEDDWLDATAVMSRRRQLVGSTAWRGGRVSAVMGEMEIDLRDARAVLEGAELRVTSVMAGVQVIVPSTWEVSVRGVAVLGSFGDKTRRDPGGTTDRLEVTGTSVMGSVEVAN